MLSCCFPCLLAICPSSQLPACLLMSLGIIVVSLYFVGILFNSSSASHLVICYFQKMQTLTFYFSTFLHLCQFFQPPHNIIKECANLWVTAPTQHNYIIAGSGKTDFYIAWQCYFHTICLLDLVRLHSFKPEVPNANVYMYAHAFSPCREFLKI